MSLMWYWCPYALPPPTHFYFNILFVTVLCVLIVIPGGCTWALVKAGFSYSSMMWQNHGHGTVCAGSRYTVP